MLLYSGDSLGYFGESTHARGIERQKLGQEKGFLGGVSQKALPMLTTPFSARTSWIFGSVN